MIKLALLALGLLACTHIRASAPEGFAPYDGGTDFRAVSADGVVYRVRRIDAEAKAELAFWAEAMHRQLVQAGYRPLAAGPIEAGPHKGHLEELAVPTGDKDFGYLVAVFALEDEVVIAEAAGELTAVRKNRDAIVLAISKTEL